MKKQSWVKISKGIYLAAIILIVAGILGFSAWGENSFWAFVAIVAALVLLAINTSILLVLELSLQSRENGWKTALGKFWVDVLIMGLVYMVLEKIISGERSSWGFALVWSLSAASTGKVFDYYQRMKIHGGKV